MAVRGMLVMLVQVLYLLCLAGLGLYAFDSLLILGLYLRHRRDVAPPPPAPAEWPRVTVQLPVYNELYTAERLLAAAARLDYPGDRLEIQVLDDSTDETRPRLAEAVRRLRAAGVAARHLTRPRRDGYKAGALAAGLACARGELTAIFDADFVPEPDFLRRVVPHFADPRVACVQTRWGHTNRDYSVLTGVQALALDATFGVEQTARSRSGLFVGFNGSAGIWRRRAIVEAGGWQADTLTEDLDLSYRAQLVGWRVVYLPGVTTPGELPVQMRALEKQQARWARGSTQTALKLVGPILRSGRPWPVKVEGVLRLTAYSAQPLLLLLGLLSLLLAPAGTPAMAVGPWVIGAAVGAPLLGAVGQPDGGRPWTAWLRRAGMLPVLLLVAIGLAPRNSWAMLEALLGRGSAFQRTPKHAVRAPGEAWVGSVYALGGDRLAWVEVGLALAALGVAAARPAGSGYTLTLWLWAAGLLFVAGLSLRQAYERRRWLASRAPVGSDRVGDRPARQGEREPIAPRA